MVDAKEQKKVEKFSHIFQNDTKQRYDKTLGYFWILIIMLQAVQKACKLAKLPCSTYRSDPLNQAYHQAIPVVRPQESQIFVHFHWVLKVSWFLPLLWLWLLVLVLLFLHVELALNLNDHQHFLVFVFLSNHSSIFARSHQIHQLFRRKKEKNNKTVVLVKHIILKDPKIKFV